MRPQRGENCTASNQQAVQAPMSRAMAPLEPAGSHRRPPGDAAGDALAALPGRAVDLEPQADRRGPLGEPGIQRGGGHLHVYDAFRVAGPAEEFHLWHGRAKRRVCPPLAC
jgi:hypothetical protein